MRRRPLAVGRERCWEAVGGGFGPAVRRRRVLIGPGRSATREEPMGTARAYVVHPPVAPAFWQLGNLWHVMASGIQQTAAGRSAGLTGTHHRTIFTADPLERYRPVGLEIGMPSGFVCICTLTRS